MDDQLTRSNYQTALHIMEVTKNLHVFAKELLDRADEHDASKLEEPEASGYAGVVHKLHGLTYGSPEYKAGLAEIRPTIDHHYANNRHHPQHWKNGVRDMNLVDVVEMFCDWLAASKRHDDGNIHKSIEINGTKFEMGQVLTSVFENTAKLFDE
jgi:hypothetical protein